MRGRFLWVSAVVALLLPASARVLAHHSFAAEFEYSEASWTGTISKIEWRLPHVHFYVDVKDSSGNVVNWCFELPSPEQLLRRGMTKRTLKIGDSITIVAYPARDKQPMAMTRKISLSDGRLAFVTDYEDFGGNKIEDILVTPDGERLQPQFP